jgi:hypothetical protein
VLAAGAMLVVLVVAAAAGYAIEQRGGDQVTLSDSDGSLTVTVPGSWHRAVASDGWEPSTADADYPALSVGTAADWTDPASTHEGVFLGILPGTELPEQMPQHPECETALEPVDDTFGTDDDPMRTVVYTDCPGGVTVERVVQLASNRLLWVQVRSAERSTANAVLDDVETHGY